MSDPPRPVERLAADDLMSVWPEDKGWPQDIGALAVVDGDHLLDADGRVRIEALRQHVGRRLHQVPRFRQFLCVPGFGLGSPLWVDAPSFDITEHIGVLPVPPPGDDADVLRSCETLRRCALPRSRPLWEMWFLPGLPNRRVGLLMRMHHAIADGVAGVATLGAFVDAEPDPPHTTAPPWTPSPAPTRRDLLVDNLRRRRAEAERTFAPVAHPVDTLRKMQRSLPAMREIFAEERAPRTSVNRRIGSDRRLAIIRGRLDVAKDVAHAHNAKVNDVLLTSVARGYRALLQSRGEPVDDLVLRAFVPVSLHQEQPGRAQGNIDAAMVVPLPIGELDDARLLERIAAESAERKRKSRPSGGSLFRSVTVQRAFLNYTPYQRMMNAYVADVPGPPVPLYFAGAAIREIFPLVPLLGNMTIGVGALSYGDQFNITVVADRQLCPDVGIFVAGVERALHGLADSLRGPSRPEISS
jgi:diacylglycerol O-acyltransferase / wax synthase